MRPENHSSAYRLPERFSEISQHARPRSDLIRLLRSSKSLVVSLSRAFILVSTLVFANPAIPASSQPETFVFALQGAAAIDRGDSQPGTEDLPRNLTSIDIADVESEVVIAVEGLSDDSVYTVDAMVFADALSQESIIRLNNESQDTAFTAEMLGMEDGLWHHLTIEINSEKFVVRVDGSEQRRFENLRQSSSDASLLSIGGMTGRLDQLTMTTQYKLPDGRARTRLLGALAVETSELPGSGPSASADAGDRAAGGKLANPDGEVTGENQRAESQSEPTGPVTYELTNETLEQNAVFSSGAGELESSDQAGLYPQDQFSDEQLLLDDDQRAIDEEFIDEQLLSEEALLEEQILFDQQQALDEQQLLAEADGGYANENAEANAFYSDTDEDGTLLIDDGDPVYADSAEESQTVSANQTTSTASVGGSTTTAQNNESTDGSTTPENNNPVQPGTVSFPILSGGFGSSSSSSSSSSSGSSSGSSSNSSGGNSSGSTSGSSSGSNSSGSNSGSNSSSGNNSSSGSSSGSTVDDRINAPRLGTYLDFDPGSDESVIAWFKLDGDWQPAPNSDRQIRDLELQGNPQFDRDTYRWTDRPDGEAVRVFDDRDWVTTSFESTIISSEPPDSDDNSIRVTNRTISVSAMVYVDSWAPGLLPDTILGISNDLRNQINLTHSQDGLSVRINDEEIVAPARIDAAFRTDTWQHVLLEFSDDEFVLKINADEVESAEISNSVLQSFATGETTIQLGGMNGWVDELLLTRVFDQEDDGSADGDGSLTDGGSTSGGNSDGSGSTDGSETDGSGTTGTSDGSGTAQRVQSLLEFALETDFEESTASVPALETTGRVDFAVADATVTSEASVAARAYGQGDEMYAVFAADLWDIDDTEKLTEITFQADIRVRGFNHDRRVPLLQLRGPGDAWFSVVLDPDERDSEGNIVSYGGSSVAAAGKQLIRAEILEGILADRDWHTIQFTMTESTCSASVDTDTLISRVIDCAGLLKQWSVDSSELIVGNFNGWVRNLKIDFVTQPIDSESGDQEAQLDDGFAPDRN